MQLQELLNKISNSPETVEFAEVIETIGANYEYTPTEFTNGIGESAVTNAAGTNEGSCKIFAFAQLQDLTPEQTLHCFGKYYREDVLQHPEATDHGNIRSFMISSWEGISFTQAALKAK